MKWADEERAKTTAWVEEQKAIIAREKRNAMASRARTGGESAPPTRKERGEIQVYTPTHLHTGHTPVNLSNGHGRMTARQALQATIEKMKVDYEALRKKGKINESRLQQLVKDQNDIIAGNSILLDIGIQ